MRLAQGHCKSVRGECAKRYSSTLHTLHFAVGGGRVRRNRREEGGGIYRQESTVNCDAIHDIQGLISLDQLDHNRYTIRKFTPPKDGEVWLEPAHDASTADICVKNGSHKTASRHAAQLQENYQAAGGGHELRL